MRLRALVVPLVALPCAALGQTSTSQDAQVQVPELAAPQRASVAGQLASTVFGPADVARGAFSLPSPMSAPEERGKLQASVFPAYSPDSGMGEWGLGWGTNLFIRRSRLVGTIDYATDELTSPFGRLVKGADGYWYPAGLSQPIRVSWPGGDTITAYLPDGTRQTYGGAARVQNGSGIYAWPLTEVVSATGRRTSLAWEANATGQLFLSAVSYGGVGSDFQYRIAFSYEALPIAFTEYRSRYALTIDRRVKTVTVQAKSASTGVFEERWRYEVGYTDEGLGPASYLSSVQQVYRSGERPPAASYTYNLARPRLESAQLEPSPKVNAVLLAFANTGAIQPNKSGALDADLDGLTDLENARDYQLARQTETGFVFEPLGAMPADVNVRCRRTVSSTNAPRTITSFDGSDTSYVVDLYATSTQTTLTVCNRLGQQQGTQKVAGNWQPSATVKLADLNQDHKPDLIRVQTGSYLVLPNTSGGGTYGFGAMVQGTLRPSFTPDTAWVQDLNGDGVPDIVVRNASSLTVWYGRGNYQFETQGATLPIKTALGYISKLTDYSLTFLDANKDGLTDVILTKTVGNVALLMVNRGARFEEVVVPGLRAVNSTLSAPVVADLTGSGNAEVTYTRSWDGLAVTLDGPETGLLAAADDGKGTVLSFQYGRSRPAPGARSRQAVLERLYVQSSGYADVSYRYHYDGPAHHSEAKFFVGYRSVVREDGDVLGSPLSTSSMRFLQGDTYSALLEDSTVADGYAPGVEKYTHREYEDAPFQGFTWKRLALEESGWQGADPAVPGLVRETTRYLGYQRDVCPAALQKETGAGTLFIGKRYADLPAFAPSLACIPDDVTESTPPDARYPFAHETAIAHNEVGQVTQVASVAGPDVLVLQTASYDAQWRVRAISAPGRGVTSVTYDPITGLVSTITAPTEVVARAAERDPLTDALLWLQTDRGALVHEQWFRFDGQERLATGWDNLGSGAPYNPDFTLSYRYATLDRPASTLATVLVDTPSTSVKTVVDLLTARGEDIGSATQIPEGWAVGRLTFRDPAAGTTTTYTRATLGPGVDPGGLPNADLFEATDWVTQAEAGPLGAGVTTRRLHLDVQQQIVEALAVVQGALVTTSTENGAWARTHAADAAGRITGFWNEAGTAWTYGYDALGRLREIRLPDGTGHRVTCDGHGRVARIERDGIAAIDYVYDPGTGLLAQKRFTGSAGVLRRQVFTTYDGIGRLAVEKHLDPITGEARTFRYFYDGASASSPSAGGQLGLLTGVTGQGYEKVLAYRADGKLAARTLKLGGGWRTVVTTLDYDEAGGERARSTAVLDAAGATVASSATSERFDPYGRAAATMLAGSPMAGYTYDAEGLLESATFTGGGQVHLEHDPLTRALVGSAQRSGAVAAAVSRRLSARGLVDRDDISVGPLTLHRAYRYGKERFLERSTDERATSIYTNGAAGVPAAVIENDLAVEIPTQADDLGRTVRRNDLLLSYGPDGQLASATRGATTWSYLYDETGLRLLKYADGAPVAAYPPEGYLDASGLYQGVKVSSRVVGLLAAGAFEPIPTDLLGTPISDPSGAPRIASPYGSRWLDGHAARSAALDYVEKGFDADLGLVRMGYRDYDPELARFATPDPLFLQNPDECVASPVECGLFGYAGGAPTALVDPSGLALFITNEGARPNFREQVFAQVKQLAPTAVLNQQTGEVTISGPADAGHAKGTELIRAIAEDKHAVIIKYSEGTPGAKPFSEKMVENHEPVGGFVHFRLNSGQQVGTYVNGKAVNAPISEPTLLAHELIHALHYQKGEFDGRMAMNTYTSSAGKVQSEYGIRAEEFQTSGMANWQLREPGAKLKLSVSVTENDIRRERNENPRASYGPPF